MTNQLIKTSSEDKNLSLSQLLQELEALTGKPIIYRDRSPDPKLKDKLRRTAEAVEKNLAQMQSEYSREMVNLTAYSPFRYKDIRDLSLGHKKDNGGSRYPTWQAWLWMHFINKKGEFDFRTFERTFLFVNKPRQIGFSYTLAALVSTVVLHKKNISIIVGTATKDWVQRFFNPYMRKFLPALDDKTIMEYRYNSQLMEYRIFDSVITIVGIDTQKERTKGLSGSLAVMDEAAMIKNFPMVMEALYAPIALQHGGMIVGSTPKSGANYFKDLFTEELAEELKEYKITKIKTYEFNIFESMMYSYEQCCDLVMGFYEGVRFTNRSWSKRQLLEVVAQEYLNYWTEHTQSMGKLAVEFNRSPHGYIYPSESPFDYKGMDCYCFIDYGSSERDAMAVTFVAVNQYNQAFVFDEIYEPGAYIDRTCQAIHDTLSKYGMTFYDLIGCYIDPTISARDLKMSEGYVASIQQEFANHGIEVTPTTRMRKKERWDIFNKLFIFRPKLFNPFKKEFGAPRIFISNQCSHLIKELYTLEVDWSESKKTITQQFNTMKNDHACFVGTTQTLTSKGWKQIKDVEVGDIMITPLGKKRCMGSKTTGISDTLLVCVNGSTIQSTPDHIFLTTQGWLPIAQILSSTKKESIILMGGITSPSEGVSTVNADSMSKYGRITMWVSLVEGIMSIILTRIERIIASTILSCWRAENTLEGTQSLQRGSSRVVRHLLNMLDPQLLFGTAHKRGGIGMAAMLKNNGSKRLGKAVSANNANRLFLQRLVMLGFAQCDAIQKTSMKKVWLTRFVAYVAIHIFHLAKTKPDVVLPNAHRHYLGQKEEVYNLTVDGGCYVIEGGAIVSNCDSLLGYSTIVSFEDIDEVKETVVTNRQQADREGVLVLRG